MTRPQRITTMVDTLAAGGAERVAVELACALDRERFEPQVLVTREDGPLRRLLDDADVPTTVLGRRSRYDLAPWREARRHLAARTDLLHCHKYGSNAWGAIIGSGLGVPLVAHEHNFSERAGRMRRIVDRQLIARRADRILCVSDSVAEVELASGVPPELIEVVANGVRTDAALPREAARSQLGLEGESFTVGIVGRLRPEKGHERALEAVAQLAARGRDVRMVVVGDGPCAAELKLLAGRLGIAGRVTWAGEHPQAALLPNAFDVALLTSFWEGLPLAALEAMAAGVPVVASSVGGLPQLLRDDAGVLVESQTPAAFADAIELLLDEPQRRASIGQAGHRRIIEQYSFETMVRRVEHLYELLLSTGIRSASADSEERAA